MSAEEQKTKRPWRTVLEGFLALVYLLLVFRFTAAVALLALVLLYTFFPLHHSRRAIIVAYSLFVAALLIPADLHVPGFHGSLRDSKHSGPRFVEVIYGLGAHRTDGGEFISGGCVTGIHGTKWGFVWD